MENKILPKNTDAWDDYFDKIEQGSLDKLKFDFYDIDRSVFIIEEENETFRLESGDYINIHWNGDQCITWKEEDYCRIRKLEKEI